MSIFPSAIFLLSGIIAASRHTLAISAPLYPCVSSTNLSQSIPSSIGISFKLILKSYLLPSISGRAMYILFSNRLLNASSRSWGRLVAASTVTFFTVSYVYCSFAPALLVDVTPSIYIKSSAFTRRLASCSPLPPLDAAIASISSKKIVVGA